VGCDGDDAVAAAPLLPRELAALLWLLVARFFAMMGQACSAVGESLLVGGQQQQQQQQQRDSSSNNNKKCGGSRHDFCDLGSGERRMGG
jgi:hypothetical protein